MPVPISVHVAASGNTGPTLTASLALSFASPISAYSTTAEVGSTFAAEATEQALTSTDGTSTPNDAAAWAARVDRLFGASTDQVDQLFVTLRRPVKKLKATNGTGMNSPESMAFVGASFRTAQSAKH